jgi:hypothetical protein
VRCRISERCAWSRERHHRPNRRAFRACAPRATRSRGKVWRFCRNRLKYGGRLLGLSLLDYYSTSPGRGSHLQTIRRSEIPRGTERWPSGLRQRFAKPSQGLKPCRGFKSRPLRQPSPGYGWQAVEASCEGGWQAVEASCEGGWQARATGEGCPPKLQRRRATTFRREYEVCLSADERITTRSALRWSHVGSSKTARHS